MDSLACLNGEILPADRAVVPIWDRGFLFGDSVYEVFRLYSGRLWLEEDHFGRLSRSLSAMEFLGVDFDRLRARIARTIAESRLKEATVYIQLTRGVAPRLHAFPDPPVPPTELIVVRPYDDSATADLRETGVPTITRPDLRWKRCDVKSTNLLANVLANEAAHRAGAYEALLIDDQGFVTEATHSSLLWVRQGRLEGSPEGPGILPGTTRRGIPSIAADEGLPIVETRLRADDLASVDEVILTGTTIEVMPVSTIDGRPVGDGRPGPVTRRLQRAFRDALGRWLGGDGRS